MHLRFDSNSRFSYLSLMSAEITGVNYHTWPRLLIFIEESDCSSSYRNNTSAQNLSFHIYFKLLLCSAYCKAALRMWSFNKLRFIYFVCMNVFLACMYHNMCMPGAHGGQKMVVRDSLELLSHLSNPYVIFLLISYIIVLFYIILNGLYFFIWWCISKLGKMRMVVKYLRVILEVSHDFGKGGLKSFRRVQWTTLIFIYFAIYCSENSF